MDFAADVIVRSNDRPKKAKPSSTTSSLEIGVN